MFYVFDVLWKLDILELMLSTENSLKTFIFKNTFFIPNPYFLGLIQGVIDFENSSVVLLLNL